MIGAGTFISAILKIVTTVAILGAVYLFIVKPVLDTTNTAFEAIDGFGGFEDLPGTIKSEVEEAFDDTDDPKALQRCIKRAVDDGARGGRVDRCVERLGG